MEQIIIFGKCFKNKTASDSNDYVRGWINTHGGELITRLSDESRLAVMNVILRGQGLRMAPRNVAKEVRPLIGLNDRQAAANQRYKQEILRRYLERGMSESKAAERAEKAALKYAGKQHRYRAETIVLTENAFAYNRGAHMSVIQSIADGYMGRCAMIWTTAGTNRVCSRCLALKDTVVGYTDELGVLLPPLHPRCRCAIMYDEVGTPRATRPKPTINPLLPAAVATEIISPATPEPQLEPTPSIEGNESYRLITPELSYKPVSEERYNQLIIPLKKMGVTIMRGGEYVERHLDFMGAEASNFGTDVVFFREKVSVSAILEETHHIRQNRQGLNANIKEPVRSWLNEIDAKKYLLRVADKYGIPREEIATTKIQIKNYEKLIEEWRGGE